MGERYLLPTFEIRNAARMSRTERNDEQLETIQQVTAADAEHCSVAPLLEWSLGFILYRAYGIRTDSPNR